MKRYNEFNSKFVLFGLVIPILLFFVTYTFVYAYFTASFNKNVTTTSAVVKVGFTDYPTANKTSHSIKSNNTTVNTTTLIPGNTLVANAKIINEGTVDIYSIFYFNLQIEKTNGETENSLSSFYTFTNTGSITKITANNGLYTKEACLLIPNEEVEVSVTTHFKGSVYGNEYKNAKITYSFTAYAIQTVGIGSAINATNILANAENSNYKNIQILGNTVQNGTPTIYDPVEIESVGDKTKNLFNLNDLLNAPNGNLVNTSGVIFEVTNLYKLELKANTTYTMSSIGLDGSREGDADSNRSLYFQYADGVNCVFDGNPVIVTTDSTGVITIGLIATRSNAQPILNKTAKVQLEEGSSATDYEPYGYKIPVEVTTDAGTETHNIYLDQPLRKIGNYTDYIDFATGNIVRYVKSATFNGTEAWELKETGSQTERAILNLQLVSPYIYCNIGVHDANANSGTEFAIQADTSGYIRFYRPFEMQIVETEATVENWKAYLTERYNNGNPIVLNYVTNSFTIEQIDLPSILSSTIKSIEVNSTVEAQVLRFN